jgi:hypothetical protein
MSWFHKKTDVISDRSRALNNEIAALEAEIKKLDLQVGQASPQQDGPRLRSTTVPHGTAPHRIAEHPAGSGAPVNGKAETPARATVHEPIFEEVDKDRLNAHAENGATPAHFNELGVRKYDLPALVQKLRQQFRGPSTTNPKLVNYLAAGGIQGLRPMRYEKRVARNRFVALVALLFVIMLGIILAFVNHH